MKLEDLLRKYTEKTKSKEKLTLTEEEKKIIDNYLNEMEIGEIRIVAPITNAITEFRFGDKRTSNDRANVANAIREYLTEKPGFEYIPRPKRYGYQPAKVKRLK